MTSSTLGPARTPVRQISLRIDESRMTTTYANAIRTSTTSEEVVLDFGMSLPATGNNAQVLAVDSRVVMNWGNAKRLAVTLAQLVQTYEAQNGEIPITAPAGETTTR